MIRNLILVSAAAATLTALVPSLGAAQPYPYRDDWRYARPAGPVGAWGPERSGWGYFAQVPFPGFAGYYGCWHTTRVATPAGPRVYREWTCY